MVDPGSVVALGAAAGGLGVLLDAFVLTDPTGSPLLTAGQPTSAGQPTLKGGGGQP